MARQRKRHVQQELRLPAPGRTRRNKPGAGRPRKQGRASERHEKRERFDTLRVVHATLRLVPGFGTLRKRDTYDALKRATRAVLEHTAFRIIHVSPEDDHIHLIVEAEGHEALWRGMQAFQISAAQHLNRAVSKRSPKYRLRRRTGRVFADRYFPRVVTSPTQARHTLNYVLNNWRRHNRDESSREMRFWDIDYMSSAISFDGWRELERPDFAFLYRMPLEDRLCVSPPHSWLLRVGWRKAGGISMYATPGSSPTPSTRKQKAVTSSR